MRTKIYSFEKLTVWGKSKDFVICIYNSVEKGSFPGSELFGLVSQLKRAAGSIPSNIAEGTSRSTPKDKRHFLTIAYSSAIEVLNHLIISLELGYINEPVYLKLREKIQEITALLAALRKSIT